MTFRDRPKLTYRCSQKTSRFQNVVTGVSLLRKRYLISCYFRGRMSEFEMYRNSCINHSKITGPQLCPKYSLRNVRSFQRKVGYFPHVRTVWVTLLSPKWQLPCRKNNRSGIILKATSYVYCVCKLFMMLWLNNRKVKLSVSMLVNCWSMGFELDSQFR